MKTPGILRCHDHRMSAKKSCRQRIELARDRVCVWGGVIKVDGGFIKPFGIQQVSSGAPGGLGTGVCLFSPGFTFAFVLFLRCPYPFHFGIRIFTMCNYVLGVLIFDSIQGQS